MKDFNLNSYLKELEESENINRVTKINNSEISGNYFFVSYAKKDYKKVYRDIARFYDNGYHFWYDAEGLRANENWKEAVFKHIEDGFR